MKQNISIALLESKWVTDDIVQVVFDILNSNIVHKEIFFVNPVSSLAIKTMIDFGEFLLPHNLENKKFIFFFINNFSSTQELDGLGSHWSLLQWHEGQDKFYNFHSLDNLNFNHAKVIHKRLATFYNSFVKPSLTNVKTARQRNSVDCVLHLLLAAEHLILKITAGLSSPTPCYFEEVLLPKFSESQILTKRAQLALIIHNNQYIK